MVMIKKDYLAILAVVLLLVVGLFAAYTSDNIKSHAIKDCHTGENGEWSYCSLECKCDVGEGDCDGNTHCRAGLSCLNNAGLDYGLDSWTDVCVEYPDYLEYKEKHRPEPVVMG